MKQKKLQNFIQKRKYLFWDVHLDSLDESAVVERILNYGDWSDVREMFKLIGIDNVARIFEKQTANERNNYDKKIKNYFRLYFNKYA